MRLLTAPEARRAIQGEKTREKARKNDDGLKGYQGYEYAPSTSMLPEASSYSLSTPSLSFVVVFMRPSIKRRKIGQEPDLTRNDVARHKQSWLEVGAGRREGGGRKERERGERASPIGRVLTRDLETRRRGNSVTVT